MTEANLLAVRRNEVRNLLVVLLGAVFAAGATLALLVFYLGPSGHHTVKNILLSPEVMDQLAYRDPGAGAGSGRMVFNKIELHYVDARTGQSLYHEVSRADYERFYQYLGAETSMLDVPERVLRAFETSRLSSLVLSVRPESSLNGAGGQRTFQELHFADDGEHFRIELRMDASEENWAYYRLAGVRNKAIQILTGN